MSVDDFQRFHESHRRELEHLENAPIDEEDRAAIQRYHDQRAGDLAVSTLTQYVKTLRQSAERSTLPLVEFDEDAFWSFRTALATNPEYNPNGDTPLADTTVHNYAVALRQFFAFLDYEWADNLELSQPDSPDIDPDDMLTQGDIAALRGAATRNRDVALVEFLADTGARLSMVGSLRVQDVALENDRPHYRPNPNATGLKGVPIKRYPIIDATAALRAYLRHTHPRPERDDAALFHKVPGHGNCVDSDDDGCLSSSSVRSLLKRLAEIAEPVNA